MRNKYFYPIFKLKTKSWIRYWLLKKTEFKGKLSEILEGFSFNLQNTLRQKFVKFEIEGHSIQDGEPSPENEVPILSSGDNGSITEKITNGDNTEEQTYTIPTQQPMRSIGDVRDVFFKNTVDSPYYDENLLLNGWYERHYINRYVFTGEENFVLNRVKNDIYYYQWNIGLADKLNQLNAFLRCNYFRQITINEADNGLAEGIANGLYPNYSIKIGTKEITSLDDFKAWLVQLNTNGNPLYIDYLLATPLDLPCTQSQIDILENLPITYEGQTNVYSTDEVKPFLKIQYWESDTNG